MVFTTRGVLMWVNDLTRWAENCVRLLRPGGVFYLLDIHPLAMVLHPAESGYALASSYFGNRQPTVSTPSSRAQDGEAQRRATSGTGRRLLAPLTPPTLFATSD